LQVSEVPQKDTMFSLEINFQEEVVEVNNNQSEDPSTSKTKNLETDVESLKAVRIGF
jgi:acyl carrier protein